MTKADQLSAILLEQDPTDGLWAAVDSGLMEELVPELLLLRMEQDPIHTHKEVLSHTIAVTAKTDPEIVVRLSALFHDIAKPQTRSFDHGGVTFRHHEIVGSRMTRKRLTEMEYADDIVEDVAEMVRLSGRFKGFAEGWSDSAVRRYARDAGPLLGRLNHLVRCDCTTRHKYKEDELQKNVDRLEERIAELAEADRRAAERPGLDGDAIMAHLGIGPGRHVGQALEFLMEIKRTEGDLPTEELESRLDRWWAAQA